MCTQHFRDREHQVSSGSACRKFTEKFETNNAWDQHRHRLTQHRRFGFNPTHTPTKNTQTINHRGVGVGPHNCVGVGLTVAHHDNASKVFNVDLVDDSGARWHDLEFVKCSLTPTQELVTLLVALVLQGNVETESFRCSEVVRDHGVVDDQFRRRQRVDLRLIAAQITHCLAHCR